MIAAALNWLLTCLGTAVLTMLTRLAGARAIAETAALSKKTTVETEKPAGAAKIQKAAGERATTDQLATAKAAKGERHSSFTAYALTVWLVAFVKECAANIRAQVAALVRVRSCSETICHKRDRAHAAPRLPGARGAALFLAATHADPRFFVGPQAEQRTSCCRPLPHAPASLHARAHSVCAAPAACTRRRRRWRRRRSQRRAPRHLGRLARR